jgi:hypothetical protein
MDCSSQRSLRGVPKISQKRGRLGQRLIVGARDPALDAEVSVVSCLFEPGEARKELEVPFSRLEAVAVGDVDDVLPGRPDARRDICLFARVGVTISGKPTCTVYTPICATYNLLVLQASISLCHGSRTGISEGPGV